MSGKKRNDEKNVEVVRQDLRALLFWATVGVSRSRAGSYSNIIEHVLESYADFLHYKLPYPPRFKSAARRRP